MHTLYTKKRKVFAMELSKQASWKVRKIITMRKNWPTLGQSSNFIQEGDFTGPVNTNY